MSICYTIYINFDIHIDIYNIKPFFNVGDWLANLTGRLSEVAPVDSSHLTLEEFRRRAALPWCGTEVI